MSAIAKHIDSIITLGLAPFLKSTNFKKKSNSFYKNDEKSICVINVQLNKWNIGNDGRFTINIGRYFSPIAHLEGKAADLVFPKEYECTVRRRIGSLLPEGTDLWWAVGPHTDNIALAAEVREAVDKFAIPWLRTLDTPEGIRAAFSSFPTLTAASVELFFGDPTSAAKIAMALIQERPAAQKHILDWAKRNAVELY